MIKVRTNPEIEIVLAINCICCHRTTMREYIPNLENKIFRITCTFCGTTGQYSIDRDHLKSLKESGEFLKEKQTHS